MANSFSWNGAAMKARLVAEMGRRLDAAAIEVENHAKELVGREGAEPAPADRTLKSGRKVRKGTLQYGARRSKPFEPPMKQTGQLQSSIGHERQGMIARVGSPLKKALWLEIGTATLAPRPWLRRALAERAAAVRAILGRPVDLR